MEENILDQNDTDVRCILDIKGTNSKTAKSAGAVAADCSGESSASPHGSET